MKKIGAWLWTWIKIFVKIFAFDPRIYSEEELRLIDEYLMCIVVVSVIGGICIISIVFLSVDIMHGNLTKQEAMPAIYLAFGFLGIITIAIALHVLGKHFAKKKIKP